MPRPATFLLVLLVGAGALHAQLDDCTDGGAGTAIFDDGTFESAISSSPAHEPLVTHAMKVTPPYPLSRLESVCVCWSTVNHPPDDDLTFDVAVWAANGPGGSPGTLLGKLPHQLAADVPDNPLTRFYRYDLRSAGIRASGPVYIGPAWDPGEEELFYVCLDMSEATPEQPIYYGTDLYARAPVTPLGDIGPGVPRAMGVRAIFAPDPDPPATTPLTSPALPGYQFWVRIGDTRSGTLAKTPCPGETVCVAGAIPTRSEVFVRLVGPKPNGYLWPNIVKFNTTKTEVWIRQAATGETRYYLLPALAPDSDVLPGLVDRTGFLP